MSIIWLKYIKCHILNSSIVLSALLLGSVEPLNCSEPTTKSLLNAMKEEVISYSEARPVISLKTPTNVSVDLTLYGILGVVSKSMEDYIFYLKKITKLWHSNNTNSTKNGYRYIYFPFQNEKSQVLETYLWVRTVRVIAKTVCVIQLYFTVLNTPKPVLTIARALYKKQCWYNYNFL